MHGEFSPDNWQCETALALRDIADRDDAAFRDSDEALGVIPFEGAFVVISWYKNRGRTGMIVVMQDGEEPRKLNLSEAEKILAHYEAQHG